MGISKVQSNQVEQFIEYLHKVRNLSENTLRSYQTDLLSFAQWCSRENVDLTQVDHKNLRLYLAYLKQAQYSAKTLNRHLSALRGFYKWMQREKLIATDPTLALSNPRAPRNLPHTQQVLVFLRWQHSDLSRLIYKMEQYVYLVKVLKSGLCRFMSLQLSGLRNTLDLLVLRFY